MSQQHGVGQVVHGYDFREGAAGAQQIADLHGYVGLQVAFAGAGHAFGRQKRMTHDEAALQLLVMIAVRAVIIIGKAVQPPGLHQPLLCRRHPAGPVQLFLGGLFRNGIRGGIAADGEEPLHLGPLFRHLRVGDLVQLAVQVAHFQQLHVKSQLRLQHGEIAVHVQHAGIVVAQESEPGVRHGTLYLRGSGPFQNFRPGLLRLRHVGGDFVRHGDFRGLFQAQQTVYHVEGNTGPLKGVGGLRHGAAYAMGQPFAGAGFGVIHLGGGLQIQPHCRRFANLVHGQHGAAGEIGGAVGENNVHIVGVEVFARLTASGFVVYQTEIVHLAHLAQPFGDEAVVAQQPVFQSGKLRPVSVQARAVQADACFQHGGPS